MWVYGVYEGIWGRMRVYECVWGYMVYMRIYEGIWRYMRVYWVYGIWEYMEVYAVYREVYESIWRYTPLPSLSPLSLSPLLPRARLLFPASLASSASQGTRHGTPEHAATFQNPASEATAPPRRRQLRSHKQTNEPITIS